MSKRRGNGEGSIYKPNDGRWVGQYLVHTVKGPKYRYLYGKTRREVDEKLTKAKAERNGRLVFDAGALTLAEYMDRWLRESARNRLRSKTYKDYEGLTRVHIVPALGQVRLKKLTPLHVQQFYGASWNPACQSARWNTCMPCCIRRSSRLSGGSWCPAT